MSRAPRLPGPTQPRLRYPDTLPGSGLLVGWSLEKESPRRSIGFTYGDPARTPATGYIDPILCANEGHLVTIAPTGAGKGVACIVPALLRHAGPVICVDPKGENVAITARRRREMGQQVIVVDPMHVTDEPGDAFNPLDLIDPTAATAVDDISALVASLWQGEVDPDDRFWVNRAQALVASVALHVLTENPRSEANFAEVRDLVNEASSGSDPLLDAMRRSENPEVRRAIALLGIRASETLGGILAFAQEIVDIFRGPLVQAATERSTFDLDDVTRGAPLAIYLVLPPHMLESHGRLLRVWISTLVAAITRRRTQPPRPTLFVLDEAAQLGELPQLRQALTLLRGYGLQTWSFWQDASQLQRLYPSDWKTMINNCRVLQCFGALNMNAATDMAELTGFGSGRHVIDLAADEMVLQLAGDEAVIARLPDYRRDPPFAGAFDANPYYAPERDIMPRRIATLSFYERPGTIESGLDEIGGLAPPEVRLNEHVDALRRARRAPTDADADGPDPLLRDLLRKWQDA